MSVLPPLYDGLTCEELGLEATRISSRAAELTGQQGEQHVVTAKGIVVFRPARYFTGRDNASSAAELGRLKSEMGAVQAVALRKKCPIEYRTREGSEGLAV